MSAASERPKNRRVKLVGGGYKWTRQSNAVGTGSLKAQRRSLRHDIKESRMNPTMRRALKARLAELLAQKDGR